VFTGLSKSVYCYHQKQFDVPDKNQNLIEEIKRIIDLNEQACGYRTVTAELRNKGIIVNHKKVLRLMRENGLLCIKFSRKSRKYNSYKGEVGKIAKNRLHRRFYTSVPHQKITTDTTEFKYYVLDDSGNYQTKKLYLNPFLDMFNSEIISYSISERPTFEPIQKALEEAIEVTKDCPYRSTYHSDQGWAYQMRQYTKTLKKNKIFQSMSRKGNCLDNSVMENFFGILKQSIYYGNTFHSYDELKQAIDRFIYRYNHHRIKAKLEWMSPVDYRLAHGNLAA